MSKSRQLLSLFILSLFLSSPLSANGVTRDSDQLWLCSIEAELVGNTFGFMLYGYDNWSNLGAMTCINEGDLRPTQVSVELNFRSWKTTEGVDSRSTFVMTTSQFYLNAIEEIVGFYDAKETETVSPDFLRRLHVVKPGLSFSTDILSASFEKDLIRSLAWGSLTISLPQDIP